MSRVNHHVAEVDGLLGLSGWDLFWTQLCLTDHVIPIQLAFRTVIYLG